MPEHSRNFNQERAVECKRLVDEINDFSNDLNSYELKWVADFTERYDSNGENTIVTDKQYSWLTTLYERVVESPS